MGLETFSTYDGYLQWFHSSFQKTTPFTEDKFYKSVRFDRDRANIVLNTIAPNLALQQPELEIRYLEAKLHAYQEQLNLGEDPNLVNAVTYSARASDRIAKP
jgi:hypothetical protein